MNKTILVTGASRGIGRAIAHAFADCGYHVFLNCNSSVKQLREVQQEIEAQYPGAATCVPGNIGNPDDVRNIFKSIYNKCNALDVLVNNAGVSHLGLLSDMTDDEWKTWLRVSRMRDIKRIFAKEGGKSGLSLIIYKYLTDKGITACRIGMARPII